jgi:hypothetical protein
MFTKSHNILRVFLLCAVLIASPAISAHAKKDASVYDMAVINSDQNLLLYFRVKDAFNEEMEKGIASGIPVTFTFYVTLSRHQTGLSKKKILSFDFNHTLSYDALKEEYMVKIDEDDERTVIVKDFEKAKELMVQVNDLFVTSLIKLSPDIQYAIRAKVRLGKRILPLNFHYIIPFWKFWEFNTEWSEITFVR